MHVNYMRKIELFDCKIEASGSVHPFMTCLWLSSQVYCQQSVAMKRAAEDTDTQKLLKSLATALLVSLITCHLTTLIH